MKAFLAIKYYKNNENKTEIVKISNILEKQGISTINMAKDIEQWGEKKLKTPRELMVSTFSHIDNSDILIADVSELSSGVGIEIGYAYSKNKIIIILSKKKANISNTFKGIATKIIYYNNLDDLKKQLDSKKILN